MQIQFSRSEFPNGGWQFVQPQFNWEAPRPKSDTFGQTVAEIIKVRLRNPAITAKHNLSTDPETVGMELENYTRARIGLDVIDTSPPKTVPRMPLPHTLRGAVSAVVKLAQGNALLYEWIPTGKVVVQERAEARAQTCLKCPKHGTDSWTKLITGPASNKIKYLLEKRDEMKLQTPYDKDLKVCDVCLCPMGLKIWTPIDILLAKTNPTTLAEFPPNCWIARQDQP